MKRFTELFCELDRTTRTSEKAAALERYFRQAPPADLRPDLPSQSSFANVQPCIGQVAKLIANTARNSRECPPRFCYSYCMNSPIRGDFTDPGVRVPPRTLFRKFFSKL